MLSIAWPFLVIHPFSPFRHPSYSPLRNLSFWARYAMLAHRQLGIREAATKLFSVFLSRSPFRAAVASLKDIVTRLRSGGSSSTSQNTNEKARTSRSASASAGTGAGAGANANTGASTSSSKSNNTSVSGGASASADASGVQDHSTSTAFLGAYEASGLLGVCDFIIKHIPPGFLLPNWPLYFSTFEMYLSHPASTVRSASLVRCGSTSSSLLCVESLAACQRFVVLEIGACQSLCVCVCVCVCVCLYVYGTFSAT